MEDNEMKTKWQLLERWILILTFICTLAATIYSVQTSRTALQQASNIMRPWITIEGINTLCSENGMGTKYVIKNIGTMPAYVVMKREAYQNGKQIADITSPTVSRLVMMPNQVIYENGIIMFGDTYQMILKKVSVGEITQSIKINYGISRDKTDEYFIYQKLKFDQKEFPEDIKNTKRAGIWNIEESDFK
jgi:hypothetical protein